VVDGFLHAKGDVVIVMDADFSHPPEVLPVMINEINHGYDIVIGSRHVGGGEIKNWTLLRYIQSWIATLLARGLTSVKDPMSGFFAIRKEVISGIQFKSKGFKILLEILVKGKYKRIKEIPVTFNARIVGSKLKFRVILNYITDLLKLYYHRCFE